MTKLNHFLLSLPILFLLALLVNGCSPSLQANYQAINHDMLVGNWDAAAQYVAKNKKSVYLNKKNQLLFMMDYGYLLQQAQKYQASNEQFQAAIEYIDERYTKSIGANMGSLLTNDNIIPYDGEDHERILVHLLSAINYASEDNYSDARVEARLVSDRLEQYNNNYGNKSNIYRDDAFARWFAGWLLESENDLQALNDAKIDYETATRVYRKIYEPNFSTPLPTMVLEDLQRSADYLHLTDTLSKIDRKVGKRWLSPKDYSKKGQLLFIHQNGEAPYKDEEIIRIVISDHAIRSIIGPALVEQCRKANVTSIKMAFPRYIENYNDIVSSTIYVGEQAVTTELMEDIRAIAIQNLNDRIGRIRAKTITRAVTRAVSLAMQQQALKDNIFAQLAAGMAGAIYNEAIEKADTRSWTTLPAEIRAAKVYLDPGTYPVTVKYRNRNGQVIKSQDLAPVTIKAGQHIIINTRTLD